MLDFSRSVIGPIYCSDSRAHKTCSPGHRSRSLNDRGQYIYIYIYTRIYIDHDQVSWSKNLIKVSTPWVTYYNRPYNNP